MSKTTITAKMRADGTIVEVLSNGSERPFPDTPMRAMTEAEVEAAATADPDARPMTREELRTARRVPRVKTLRRALGLTQQEFATRYQIPLGTLRDWEQGRTEPDQPARAYLTVITRDPEGARRACQGTGLQDQSRDPVAPHEPRMGPPGEKKTETARSQHPRGRDLFIVDNSVSGWTGLRYLEEWTEIAKAFDIATGSFEIGALLALDGKWQSLERIRILMGSERTHRTRKMLLEAVRNKATEVLDESIEADKEANPFLNGVPAILDAFRSS